MASTDDRVDRRDWNKIIGGLLLAIVVISGLAWAMGADLGNITGGNTPRGLVQGDIDEELSESPDQGVTAADILQSPSNFMGQEVEVIAEVETDYGSRAFTLDAQGIVNDQLLVVTTEDVVTNSDQIDDDQLWRIRGRVLEFSLAGIENTVNYDFNDDEFSNFDGEPVIIADSIEMISVGQ